MPKITSSPCFERDRAVLHHRISKSVAQEFRDLCDELGERQNDHAEQAIREHIERMRARVKKSK